MKLFLFNIDGKSFEVWAFSQSQARFRLKAFLHIRQFFGQTPKETEINKP